MDIIPAIDLIGGKAVRLTRGDYNNVTVFHEDPLAQAAAFCEAGARSRHVVDLEGAKSGRPENAELIRRLSRESGLRIEAGGGIRTLETVENYLEAGACRVILGTGAVEDPDFLTSCLKRFGSGIAVGVDSLKGKVRTKGWLADSGLSDEEFIENLAQQGVRTVICTDISRDGMQQGVNLPFYERLRARFPRLTLIASGGVSSLEDVRRLKAIGTDGAIIGKALYTGAIDLKEALEAAKGSKAQDGEEIK